MKYVIGNVKMRRYKQDKENAALLQGVYLGVHDQTKRKFDTVLRRIYAFSLYSF